MLCKVILELIPSRDVDEMIFKKHSTDLGSTHRGA